MRMKIGILSSVILGVILLMSGVGKLFMGVPAQLEFISQISPSFGIPESWLRILMYVLPWVEILLGTFMVLQIYIQVVAVACVPLIISFITNNVWMMLNGDKYQHCNSCFGIFEQYIGGLSPLQASVIDLSMLGLAITVIFVSTKYRLLWGLIKND